MINLVKYLHFHNFILAVNRKYKNNEGKYDADFIRIQSWRKLDEKVANHLGKGSFVGINGAIRTHHYDDNGKRVYITEVVAESVQFLDPKPVQNQQGSNYSEQGSPDYETNYHIDDPFSTKGGPIEVSDDDLPF